MVALHRDAMKGVAALVASGTVAGNPPALALFLRAHTSILDKGQLGEYFGHHDALPVRPSQYLHVIDMPLPSHRLLWQHSTYLEKDVH